MASLMRDTIGQLLLSKVSDPRIDPALTSVTRVELPKDFTSAKVYVSVVGTEAQQRLALRALRHAAGYIQELLTRQIKLRNTPVLDFIIDRRFKKTTQTLAIIDQAMQEIRRRESAGGPAAGLVADDVEE